MSNASSEFPPHSNDACVFPPSNEECDIPVVLLNSELRKVSTDTITDDNEYDEPRETVQISAAEAFLPWKTYSQQEPITFTDSLCCDSNEPVPAQAPTWVNNLSYNHLKESGSPYASPEVTLIAEKKEKHVSVFDLFKTDALDSFIKEKRQEDAQKCAVNYAPVLPPPWSIHSNEDHDQPITSPSVYDSGDKNNLLLSNHTATPPSHHIILPTVHQYTDGSVSHEHSDDNDSAKPLKSLPGSASAPDLPKHFQVIEPMAKDRMWSASVLEDLEFHEQAISRVKEWLTTNEDSGIVLHPVPTPELLSDNDADVSDNESLDDSFDNRMKWKVSSDEESEDENAADKKDDLWWRFSLGTFLSLS